MKRENRVDTQQQPLTRLEPRSLRFLDMCFKPLGHQDPAFDGFFGGEKQCLSLMTLCCGTNNNNDNKAQGWHTHMINTGRAKPHSTETERSTGSRG